MLLIEQLEDGCYHIIVEFATDGFAIHYEWTFRECESDAKPAEGGTKLTIRFHDGEV